ncbi:MAG: N-acetylmuramoyl-L-alanine amidase, partial [Pseudonocardia sp.]|nr:N-acetylmuramoyl-L-alanine amidase [Pseudonocardia sp.]
MSARVIPARAGARAAAAAAVLAVSLVAGCGGHSVEPTPAASTAPADPTDPAAHMRTVLIDPGHNGGNDPKQMAKKVPDGRGHTKPCNTTGTSTDAGYPEHLFTYYVAARVRALLIANGINVVMTRTNDTGVGPCVDARGKQAAEANADAVVSIHADGAPPNGQGFHVIYSKPPLNAAQGAPSISLATALRDALRGAGFPESTYAGKNGLIGRSDLAGLNL